MTLALTVGCESKPQTQSEMIQAEQADLQEAREEAEQAAENVAEQEQELDEALESVIEKRQELKEAKKAAGDAARQVEKEELDLKATQNLEPTPAAEQPPE